MFGLVGSIMVLPENRGTLVDALLAGSHAMPGCVSYVVGEDSDDESVVWVTEVWESRESHQAALQLPQVQTAMAAAKPVIIGFGNRSEFEVKGGHGLS